jgi:tetratricopeptide (TPR) repeat protein/energy-coupling factor transporter ATP-binding protein EcfA2
METHSGTRPHGLRNPFPGLRPFEPDEDHLFFGREEEIDDLLRRLGSQRFLAVVGTSGSGKSSLVRSGLIPSLHSGFIARAGSSWRVAMLRPGEAPIEHLAEALDRPGVIGDPAGPLADTNRVLLEATLRRGSLGLVQAIRHARLAPGENVLVVVDQFEELFRFRRSRHIENSRDEAVAFVKLLLEAAGQQDIPLYVVLTMRSDFIGDCMEYPGLPEAVNDGLYLVPRMTRDELRSAITGPVAVAGGRIAPRLVLRLLNEIGDDQDQLPLLQHVLMRSWDHWAAQGRPSEPIDLEHYEAVGTLRHALSRHAEEAYQEAGSEDAQRGIERIFKALTDTFSDPRGVRRPTSIAELAAVCEVPEARVVEMVEIFRRPGRSFLMPPATVPLTSRTVVDLSHESLMRCWTRLIAWAQDERASAALYVRLSREASWFQEGAAGLWSDPELELGLRWKRENRPTAAWARRHDDAFDRAMEFLDRSERERDRLRAERHAQRLRKWRLAWGSAGVLAALLVVTAYFAITARRERTRAEENLRLANAAVDEMLAATDHDTARVAAEPPEMQAFRRELLERAKGFYLAFVDQDPANEELISQMAAAHLRLGHIHRALGDLQEADREYRQAIARFEQLAGSGSANRREYRQALASSYHWLGEALRRLSDRYADAEEAYGHALRIQEELATADPGRVDYRQELARTHYNRGILYGVAAPDDDPAFGQSAADFREAIRLMEPVAQSSADAQPKQELARVYNNLANLLAENDSSRAEARALYQQAIRMHESLVAGDHRNREYRYELAAFSNNLADLLREQGDREAALAANARAIALIDDLVRAAPRLAIEQADAHTLRGRILESQASQDAADHYRRSLELFDQLAATPDVGERVEFHPRFGDLLLNMAYLVRDHPKDETAGRVLSDGIALYAAVARRAAASGSHAEARHVVANLSQLTPLLTERDRRALAEPYRQLEQLLGKKIANVSSAPVAN